MLIYPNGQSKCYDNINTIQLFIFLCREAVHKCCLCDESCDSFPKFTKHINSDKHRSLMTKWIQLDSSPDKEESTHSEDNKQYTRGKKHQAQLHHQPSPVPNNEMINNMFSGGSVAESQFSWNSHRYAGPYHSGLHMRPPLLQPRLAWPPFQPRQSFQQHDFG